MNKFMWSFYGIFGIAAMLLASAARASDPLFPLADSDVVIRAWQEEINATVQGTNPMDAGGGLIGAVVATKWDKSVNTKAEAAMVGIRERLSDYPVGQVFADKLRSELPWEYVAPGADAQTETAHVDLDQPIVLQRPRLEVVPEVSLTADMNTLVVQIDAILITPSKRSEDQHDVSFMQRYEFAWPVRHLRKKMKHEEAARAWLALSREELIALIEGGMDTSIELWAFHLDNPTLPEGDGLWNPLYTATIQFGKKIDQRGDMVWLKRSSKSDWLYAVHRDTFWAKIPPQ